MPISVEVEALNKVAKVEFWWDGELLATDEAAPYEYAHDVRKVVEGKHTLSVKAYDILNYSDGTSLTLDVRVRPTLGGLWIAVVAVVVVFALIIPLAALSRRRTRAPAAPATVLSPAGPQPRRGPSRAWLVVQRALCPASASRCTKERARGCGQQPRPHWKTKRRPLPGLRVLLQARLATITMKTSLRRNQAAGGDATLWHGRKKRKEFPRRRRGLEDWDEEATEIERAPTGMLGWLIVKDGARRGKMYSIRNGTTIGRKEADVLIKDSKISRVHAKFTVEEGHFVVWDFGTPNGTFVNGTRIREATPLNENDVIKVGDTSLVLKTLEE